MKYLPLMLLALAGCKRETPAFRAYKQYADHLLNERYEQARNLADGQALDYIEYIKSLHEIVPPQTLQGASWTVESETSAGNEVRLVVLQEVIRGQTSIRGNIIKKRHTVVVTETGGRWIVTGVVEENLE